MRVRGLLRIVVVHHGVQSDFEAHVRRTNLMPAISESSNGDRSLNDAVLIGRIQAGDEEAFCDLYAEHALTLVRYATTVLGDRESAEDVVQDVFMSIWERRGTWEPRGSVTAYIYRAVRNRVLDVRSHRRIVDRTSNDALHDPTSFIPRVELADERLILNEQSSVLARAIAALPERRRIALIMRAVHRVEYATIAETLGVTEQAARILVARARESLRSSHPSGSNIDMP